MFGSSLILNHFMQSLPVVGTPIHEFVQLAQFILREQSYFR